MANGQLENTLFTADEDLLPESTAPPAEPAVPRHGTVYLDEVSELAPALQAKLLQALENGRADNDSEQAAGIRIVCSTNRDLEHEVLRGNFRRDLFFRVHLPPLRARACDIQDLVAYFLAYYSAKYGRQVPPLSSALVSELKTRGWPGNVRELENLVRLYVILGSEEVITGELKNRKEPAPPDAASPLAGTTSLKSLTRKAVQELEGRVILQVLEANNWNRKRTAQSLNISYRALLYKMRDSGLIGQRDGRASHRRGTTNPAPILGRDPHRD
jgi:DNA-binding NtrC family response regulator